MPKVLRLSQAAVAALAVLTCLAIVMGAARTDAREGPSIDPGAAARDALEWRPNDPDFPVQWHHATIRTPAAWDLARGAGAAVAVIDSGVRCDHPDLAGQCVAGWDFVDGDATADDPLGSGTRLAGVVAARANNALGGAGVAPEARIMPLRVLDADGGGDLDRLAAAITWAADHGAGVILIGVAGRFDSPELDVAVSGAIARGVSIVASVGAGDSNDRLFPAAYPGVIGVAATDQADARAPIANYGDTVDVAAPGIAIHTTTIDGRYGAADGADLAAAVVAGVAALLKSQQPARHPDLITEMLRVSAVDLGTPGWDPYFGAGRIDAGRALALDPGGNAPGPPVPTALPSSIPAPWTPVPPPGTPVPTNASPPTAPPATLPASTATAPPPPAYGTSTPGAPSCSKPWQVILIGQPDLSGAGGYACPGCDGVMSSGDQFLSTLCPLEPLEVVISDGATGIRKVLWHGYIQRDRGSVHEIRASVLLCDPPPYRVTLLTTTPEHYTLCPNSYPSQPLAQRDFDRVSSSRPGEGRRALVAWRFWSCAADWGP